MDKVIESEMDLKIVTVTLQVMKQIHKNFFISYILFLLVIYSYQSLMV